METFILERIQSLYENTVEYNLTESGVHPYSLKELLNPDELNALLELSLGYGQTNGSIELREAIAKLYPEGSVNREQVLVTNGSSEANFVAMKSLLKAGDEVLVMLPNYLQIWGIVEDMGCVVKGFNLKSELDWAPDMSELFELISPRTKMIALCHPNNPTGAVLTESEMQEIVRLAESVGAWIYADEIYRGAELDGFERPSFIGMYDKVVVNGGLSKAYALPGFTGRLASRGRLRLLMRLGAIMIILRSLRVSLVIQWRLAYYSQICAYRSWIEHGICSIKIWTSYKIGKQLLVIPLI